MCVFHSDLLIFVFIWRQVKTPPAAMVTTSCHPGDAKRPFIHVHHHHHRHHHHLTSSVQVHLVRWTGPLRDDPHRTEPPGPSPNVWTRRCNYELPKSASLLRLLIGRCRRWCVMYTQEVVRAHSRGGEPDGKGKKKNKKRMGVFVGGVLTGPGPGWTWTKHAPQNLLCLTRRCK